MSGLEPHSRDRAARQRAVVMPTQDELDKMSRAADVGVPEAPRGRRSPKDHWAVKKEDPGIEGDEE